LINYIWFAILALGIIFGIASGRGALVSRAIVDSAGSSVQLVLGLAGLMCLWCGVIKIADKSGLTEKLARIIKPILKKVFKSAGKDDKALSAIIMNLTANMMGLSNAATPFGIKAMGELKRLNGESDTASDDMALFLVLNAACIQLVPSTIISIRAAAGARNPGDIILPAALATGTAAVMGVIYCKILEKFF
jgi:spore maturation protein A